MSYNKFCSPDQTPVDAEGGSQAQVLYEGEHGTAWPLAGDGGEGTVPPEGWRGHTHLGSGCLCCLYWTQVQCC